jgi:autotransporter-associated beta strand protein
MRETRPSSVPITKRLSLLLPLLVGGLTSNAHAQITNTWTGLGANTNWSTRANWDANGVPLSGAATGLDFTGSATAANNDLGTFQLNLLQFDVAANFTLSGSALNFVSNGTTTPTLTQNTAFNIAINNNLTLTNNLTVNLAASGNVNLGGIISGAGSLTIAGGSAGYTTILSNANNSYSGGTIVAGGTLQLAANNALSSGSNLQLIGTVGGAAVDATLDLNGQNVTVGNLTFGNGFDTNGSAGNTIIADSSAGSTGLLTLNGSIIFNGGSNADPGQINSGLALASGQHLIDLTAISNISNNYYDLVLAGKISGSGGINLAMPNDPSGSTSLAVVLTNSNNSYTGATNLYQGDLFLAAANVLPSQSAVTISRPTGSGSVGLYLYIDANRTQSGAQSGDSIKAGSYNQTIGSLADAGSAGGTVYLGGATLTIGANNASTKFTGTLQDTDPNLSNASGAVLHGSIVKIGTGTLTLGGANSYTGSTTINAGTLQSGITNALPTTTNLTLTGGEFDINGNNQTLNKVTNSGGNVLVHGSTASLTANGAYTQSAGATQVDTTLNLTPGKDLTLTGGQLVGVGAIGNATASGTITVTNSGGTVRPGDLLPSVGVGALTITGNYTQQSGGAMEIDLASESSFDQLKVNNLASLAGTLDVKLLGGYMPTPLQTFTFLTYGSHTGNFGNIVALDAGYSYTVNYGPTFSTLVVTAAAAVPETSTLFSLALMVGAGGLLVRRQRRLHKTEPPLM